MKTSFFILILVATFINGFITSYIVIGEWNRSKKMAITCFIIFSIIGFAVLLVMEIIGYTIRFWNWFSVQFQLKFWWRWKFTSYYENLSDEKIERINHSAKMYVGYWINNQKEWKAKNERWLTCLRMVRKKYPRDCFKWMDNPENFIVKDKKQKKENEND